LAAEEPPKLAGVRAAQIEGMARPSSVNEFCGVKLSFGRPDQVSLGLLSMKHCIGQS